MIAKEVVPTAEYLVETNQYLFDLLENYIVVQSRPIVPCHPPQSDQKQQRTRVVNIPECMS